MLKQLVTAAVVAGALLAGPVFAHARLSQTSPADGAQLTEAPKSLTLSFAEPVKLASLTITDAGNAVPVAVDRTSKPATTVTAPLPALSRGRYEVHWSAVSADDGHVTKGTLTFTVQPAKH